MYPVSHLVTHLPDDKYGVVPLVSHAVQLVLVREQVLQLLSHFRHWYDEE